MGRKGCNDKESCCCCCSISAGIKVLGLWLLAEFLLNILAFVTRTPPQPITDGISVVLSAIIVGIFFWQFFAERNLKARQYWLYAMIVDFVIHIILALVMLINLNFVQDTKTDFCMKYPLENGYSVTVEGDYVKSDRDAPALLYGDVDECAEGIVGMASTMIIVVMFFYILTRIWFIINVRDWRDELQLANRALGGEVEMQTDRQIAPKPMEVQPSAPVGQPLYADPNDVKATNAD